MPLMTPAAQNGIQAGFGATTKIQHNLVAGNSYTGSGLTASGGILAWQVATLDISDATNCLVRFKSNRMVGWIFLAGIAADMMLRRFAGQ